MRTFSKTQLHRCLTQSARGFTLVELLVVIAIIGTLVALLLPAISAVRGRAQQATCANNQKQVGLGIINYENGKQRFPGYVQSLKRSNGDYLVIDTSQGIADSRMTSTSSGLKEESLISWAGIIAPQIEAGEVYDNMVDSDVVFGDARARLRPLEILICPADSELSALPDNAGLSYSINAGAWDRDASGNYLNPNVADQGDIKSNGISHNLSRSNVSNKLSAIKDGASNTLLLVENVHKVVEPGADAYCWAGVNSGQFAEQPFGVVWVVDATPASGSGLTFQFPFSNEGPNSDYDPSLPEHARPASNHPSGSFNVIFADGHAKAIDPSIDYTVYQRLMTVEGRKCVDPMDHTLVEVGDPIYDDFRTLAPLSAGDY